MRALAIVALCTTAASADPAPAVHAGPQAVPPVRAGEPALVQQLDARRSVRGCAVGDTCARPGDLLRQFELEAFPPPGQNPWLDERTPPPGKLEAAAPRKVRKPSELRPDAPWLDKLEMPDLPVTWSQKLVDYLVFYKEDPRGRAIISGWLAAQGRYRDMIVSHLRAAHLPEDLLYVSMIESGYEPDDKSSVGALGIWQFMPLGGRVYGLREDRWVDERKDPLRATIAVVDYWKDLYQRFGEWQIALAAFNAGYGAVLKSISRYNTNDYYQLCAYENGLPWSTCLYTPKVLATAIVGHNRAVFGVDHVKERPAEVWDEVAVPASLSISTIARAAGTDADTIKRLNPQLRRGRTPPGEDGYIVRVPVGKKADTQRRIVELESEWAGYDAYVVAHGERLEDIATTFGTSSARLKRLNDIKDISEVSGGTVLVVPRISAEQRAKNRAKALAKLQSSGVDQKEGEPMIVAVPDKDATVPGKKRVFYRVVSGDTLGEIAQAFGVKVAQLAAWNAIDRDTKLFPRMVLQAWVAPDFDASKVVLLDESRLAIVTRGSPEHLDLQEQQLGRVRTEYVAQGKEKLADIAKKYGLGSHDLARINRISYDTVLDKGQKIIVYEVKDPKRSARAEEQWKKMPRTRRPKLTPVRPDRTTSKPKEHHEQPHAEPHASAAHAPETHTADVHTADAHTADAHTADGGGPVTRPSQVE